jgi:glycosyltransferase involved in cell wall biosynthesis
MVTNQKECECARDPIVLAVVGNYLPRRCGIATFTSDLCNSMKTELNEIGGDVFAVAMDDQPNGYDYPPMVRLEIRQHVAADYRMAADYLNVSCADVVLIEHEFGIYGGEAGNYLNGLLGALRKPVIMTMHTVVPPQTESHRNMMERIIHTAERLVVMSQQGEHLLKNEYKTPDHKIAQIPHGIHDIPFVDPNFFKDELNVAGRRTILTFGLISPSKGLDLMIQAMPKIVEQYPDAIYMILGATHPHILQHSGEQYRESLIQMTKDLGVENNVMFINKFVELDELFRYIGAADVYVTPYPNKEQATSGTLAYAIGAGKAVVSTPYWHAEEMLSEGRGRLVDFGSSEKLADAIINLFDDEVERHAIRKRAYMYGRNMLWSQVAKDYIDLSHYVLRHRRENIAHFGRIICGNGNGDGNGNASEPKRLYLPEIKLYHLQNLTDRVGLYQHATCSIPQRQYGYCTDDNARALVFMGMHWSLYEDRSIMGLINAYLGFLMDAFNPQTRRFKNFMSYDLKWLDANGTEDSHGRALWGLGSIIPEAPTKAVMIPASRLFLEAIGTSLSFEYPRAIAYALVGIHCYLRRFNGDTEVRRIREQLARRLLERFNARKPDWVWTDDLVSYANARIPHALLLSGQWIPDDTMVQVGLESLEWLLKIQTGEEGQLSLIGNQGWYSYGSDKARFDQQPIDAMTLVEACIEAYNLTRDQRWADNARRCYEWFLGRNDLNLPLYDFVTGGCCDGLRCTGINENQGAESTLSWLISVAAMHQMRRHLDQTLAKKTIRDTAIPRWIMPQNIVDVGVPEPIEV